MAISDALKKEIDNSMSNLSPADYRRPNSSILQFIDNWSTLLATTEKDIGFLEAAGLPSGRLEFYKALFEMMTLIFAQRHGAREESQDQKIFFDQEFRQVEIDRRRMMAVVSHIVDSTDDKLILREYKFITKGNSIVDSLNDVISLSSIIVANLSIAAEVRPGGLLIDSEYCKAATDRALTLLKIKGLVIEKGIPESKIVDQLNRILTLCVNAQREIKKFANLAFIDDPEHYDNNYVFSTSSSSRPQEKDEETDEAEAK
jgi:hypothetical protein